MTDEQKELLRVVLNFAYGQVDLLERLGYDVRDNDYNRIERNDVYNLAESLGIYIEV